MRSMARSDEEQCQPSYLGLVGLIFGLALAATALYLLAGPPHLPAELPSWKMVVITLQSSSVPLEASAYILTTAAWVVWFWIVASLTLRLIVAIADAATHGAAWVGSLRRASNWVTLPVVRRIVDGALIAIVVVHLASRPVPSTSAATLAPPIAAVLIVPRDGAAPEPSSQETHQGEGQRTVEYTVQKGDALWAISERFYGTGHEYPRLVAANVGRRMPDGRYFTRAGVIQPGWVLLIPMPSPAIQEVDGQTYYVVEEGDTLRGIAARLLGDETRWPAIFELNRGTAKLDDRRVLRDPDLIWPGLRLSVPLPSPAHQIAEQQTRVRQSEDSVTPAPTTKVEPVATPAPAPPAREPAVAAPEPTISQAPPVAVDQTPLRTKKGDPSPLIPGAAAVAVAGAGAALLLARRRVRRSLDEPPIPTEPWDDAPARGDFAEAELARVLTHRLHGGEVEPVTLVVEQVLRFLDEHAVRGVSVVTAVQGPTAAEITLSAGLHEQMRLLELASELGRRLGGTAQASLTADHDVLLQVSGLKSVLLFSTPVRRPSDRARLLPLGALPYRSTLYANWPELGHVLVAGLPGGGAEVILTSVLCALTARCRPDELQLWTIASRRTLPLQLAGLPHQRCSFVDPTDESRAGDILAEVRAELLRRMRKTERDGSPQRQLRREQPDLVLVIGELADLKDDGTTVEMLGAQGPAHGVRLLAATVQPEALGEAVLAHFDTRMVLQTLDEEQSIRLIGHADAADLRRSDLLLRIDGRASVRARGFKVSAEHLNELARLMHDAYASTPRAPVPEASRYDETSAERGDEWEQRHSLPDKEGDTAIARAGSPLPGSAEPAAAFPLTTSDTESRPEDEPALRLESPFTTQGQAKADGAGFTVNDEPHSSDGHQTQAPPAKTTTVESLCLPLTGGIAPDEATDNGCRSESGAPAATSSPGRSEAAMGMQSARAVIQVQCLGAFLVKSGEQEITPSGEDGGQYKAWEVLAFLASHPDGAVSKEKLLAALWPDTDAESGINRLRVAMSRLRSLFARQVPGIPAEVVRLDRHGICRLDTRLVSSDVHRFLALCQAARHLPAAEAKEAYQEARAFYRGDLLAGRGARVYEWLDEREDSGISLREQYRQEYYRATQQLARILCREGQFNVAVPLYKALLEGDPTLEDVVRDLYHCYRQLGDLGSLIREDRQLRQALREAYCDPDDPKDDPECYQPEPETIELFKKIREELEVKAGARR